MSSIAFFGKMPKAADFVRRGVSAPAMRNFENWFHSAYTELRGAGARGLMHRCHMILPNRDDANGVMAVLAVPSRDRIGREFPVVIPVGSSFPEVRLHSSWPSLASGTRPVRPSMRIKTRSRRRCGRRSSHCHRRRRLSFPNRKLAVPSSCETSVRAKWKTSVFPRPTIASTRITHCGWRFGALRTAGS